jgi:hypothetical protein
MVIGFFFSKFVLQKKKETSQSDLPIGCGTQLD